MAFPVFVKTTVWHLPRVSLSLSADTWSASAQPSRCSAGIHLARAAGSLPRLMASPRHFYFCVRMWLQGLVPRIIAPVARKREGASTAFSPSAWETRRSFWLVRIFPAATICCLTWERRKPVEWHMSLLCFFPHIWLDRQTDRLLY